MATDGGIFRLTGGGPTLDNNDTKRRRASVRTQKDGTQTVGAQFGMHCPTELVLSLKGSGRGEKARTEPEVFVDALPPEPAVVTAAGGFIMPNSIGFAYEAAAVAACIANGSTRCAQWSTTRRGELLATTLKRLLLISRTALAIAETARRPGARRRSAATVRQSRSRRSTDQRCVNHEV